MTEQTNDREASEASDESERAPGARPEDASRRQLEGRLARLEAQVRAHGERLAELDQGARARKQLGLIIRLVLLALALGAFFFIKLGAGA